MKTTEEDREAIVALIARETEAFLNKDYEAWARCWVHESYALRWGYSDQHGGVTIRDGWDVQAVRMKALMAANPQPILEAAHLRRDGLKVRVGKDIAWATFDQHASRTGDGMDVAGLIHEARVLEKHGGEWKIAALFYFQRWLEHLAAALVRVDGQGAVLWVSGAATEELRVNSSLVVRNGGLRATGRAADQRLQAAIRWAANFDEGMYAGHATMPVVLDGGSGEPASVCWIVADSGLIIVAINDQRMVEHRLAAAAPVYGLSPAQIQLAKLIVAGCDLVDAAARLDVSVTTARTQLRRMFEKTGVRSQPALVRVLLSVASALG